MINVSGQVLSARFVLVRTLGHGGTGQVWLAQDRELGGHVALKILAPELAADAGLVNALEREWVRARSLVHPNILRVDGFYRAADQVWMVMEYLAGGDLTQLRGRPALEILRAANLVADALVYAHAAGVVHRDVKTANVLLGIDGSPRLADFGIALALAESPDSRQSRGSPYSMSPQQASGAPAQPADDVYAFGVLLYELLSGYPPFYPDIDADQRASQPPAPLVPRYPTSEAVIALIGRCLEKDPEMRPDMKSIAEGLRGALAAQSGMAAGPRSGVPPVLRPPASAETPLQARWQRSAPASGPTPEELRSEGFRRGIIAAALLLLLAAAGVVFFVLPDRMAASPPVVATVPAPPAAAPDQAPQDLEALAVQKQQADDLIAAVTPRIARLKDRGAEEWADKEWTALQTGLGTAEQRYTARDYVAAIGGYESAAKQLATLEARANDVLKDMLARGTAALEGGNAAAARKAFELALKLAAGQAEATRGLRRAQSLDAVMALVNQAEAAENEGKISQAADAFDRALQLDPDMRRASVGLARVQVRAAGDAFANVMARGFAALSSKDYAAAKKAFESARTLRPQAPEVQQALQQTEQEERTAIIETRLASAKAHEQAERWQQSLADYQAILQLDATVASAQQGVERTTPRATLNDELQLYVTQPERLFSAPVRETARTALARARGVTPAGPVLEKQIATLDDWLRRATIPVQVALESDNLTKVTIYRVGEMGAFTRRAVELPPGKYTVVGTRPGYRDVRREIMVAPGEAQSVVIRCEDRI